MRNRHIAAAILMACIVASVAVAGWTHFNGKTFLVPEATPATIWTRNNITGDLTLLAPSALQVFANTIQVMSGGSAVPSFGYWSIDSNNDYVLMVGNINLYRDRRLPGTLVDVEWEVDSNGDFIVKE